MVVESFENTGHIDMRKIGGCEKIRITQLDMCPIQDKPYVFTHTSHTKGVFIFDPQSYNLVYRSVPQSTDAIQTA